MTLQPADLDRLEQLAAAATPEAWDQWDWSSWRELPADGDAAGMWALDPYQRTVNVALTIALSPAVVSELVAAARLGAAQARADAGAELYAAGYKRGREEAGLSRKGRAVTATFALICALLAASLPVWDSNRQNVGLYPTISHATPSAAPENRMGDAAGRTLAGAAGAAQGQRGAPPDSDEAGAPSALGSSERSPAWNPAVGVNGGAPLTLAGGTTTGTASWFPARGMQGAVPWWQPGQPPVWATVSRFADGKTYSATVLVTGFCQCLAGQPGERLIDLSPAAFQALGASLSVGLIRVTMTVPVQGPRLPATDTLEGE